MIDIKLSQTQLASHLGAAPISSFRVAMGCSLSKDAELEKYKKKVKQLENQLKASGRFAARTAFDVPYPWEERSKVNAVKKDEVSFKSVYSGLKGSDGLFDAHLHYLNYNQETEGMNDLVACVSLCYVCIRCGCSRFTEWAVRPSL